MKKNINFTFPSAEDIIQVQEMDSLSEIQRNIKALFSKNFPMMIFPYKIFEKNPKGGSKIFCYCRVCKAKICYKLQEEGNWSIQSYQAEHSHDLRKPKIKSSQDVMNVYENFIRSLDPLPERQTLLKSMKNLFNISDPTFYRVYKRVL